MSSIKKTDHFYLVDGSGYIFRAYYALPPLSRKSDGLPSSFPLDQRKVKGEMHLASSHRIEKRIVEERKTHEIGASRKERARIRGGRNTHPQNTNQVREFPQLPREGPRLQRKGNHLRPAAYDRGGCKTQTNSVFLCGWEAICVHVSVCFG